MIQIDPWKHYKRRLTAAHKTVDYETVVAIHDTALLWATQTARLMFAAGRGSPPGLNQPLADEYRSVCIEEPSKFSPTTS